MSTHSLFSYVYFICSSFFSGFVASSMSRFKQDTFLAFFVCIWIMMTSWEFRRILVKTLSYYIKTYNLNLFCWFLVFMPTAALDFRKMMLQTFQISCNVCACAFR